MCVRNSWSYDYGGITYVVFYIYVFYLILLFIKNLCVLEIVEVMTMVESPM
jgi:hypothetical protein